jgi:hypothetical protein
MASGVLDNEDIRKQALRLIKRGWSARRISERFGCVPFTVRRWARLAGLKLNRGGIGKLSRFTVDGPNSLREFCAKCGGVTAAAERLGVSRNAIYLRIAQADSLTA